MIPSHLKNSSVTFSKTTMTCVWIVLMVGVTLNFHHGQVQAGYHSHDHCSTIATYNVGLMKLVGEYDQRKTRIPGALLENDADVYCLQEYWLERDIANLLLQVSPVYPHHYSAIHYTVDQLSTPGGYAGTSRRTSGCSRSDMRYFGSVIMDCIRAEGCDVQFDMSPELGLSCLMSNCSVELSSPDVHPECIQCLMEFKVAPNEFPEECKDGSAQLPNRLNPPGLVLLSKKPLRGIQYTNFWKEDIVVGRGYLEAKVDGIGKVICTHLTAIFPFFFEYNMTRFSDYVEMQQYEIASLTSRYADVDHVLMADLNAGPVVSATGVAEEYEAHYQRFLDAGYKNPYIAMGPGDCTYCGDNALAGNSSSLIDHILVKGQHLAVARPQRIFDDNTNQTPLSDHYGLQLTVCPTGC